MIEFGASREPGLNGGAVKRYLSGRNGTTMDKTRIELLAKQAATSTLGTGSVKSVISAPMIDSEGEEALRLTIVMSPGFVAALNEGSKVVDTMVRVHDTLEKEGEKRFPFVDFAEAEH